MIVETIIDFFCSLIYALFSGFELVSLPYNLLGALVSILECGTWVVGADIMALFLASIAFWWAVHMSIGLAIWVWKLLPLT